MIEPLPKSLTPTYTNHVTVLGKDWVIGFDRDQSDERVYLGNGQWGFIAYYEAVSVLLGGDWYALADVFTEEVCKMIQKEYDGAPE